jgi:ABC-type proline/glycine betaine transport system permease subunit
MSAVILSDVPTSTWTYGCAPTSAGMIFGYYDRNGYPNMYTGPCNGGVAPLTDLGQGNDPSSPIAGSCSIIATQNGFDGRNTFGHVDDYWTGYGNTGPDPWDGNWLEHAWGGCTADYMGSNQWKWDSDGDGTTDCNADGATCFFCYSNGAKLDDYVPPASAGLPQTEGCHGMRLFAESRGYTVLDNYTQNIAPNVPGGFSFSNYKAKINAGKPMLIQLVGHTMVGVGYESSTRTVYVHDTWDNSTHSMTWGGSYDGMSQWGVTVLDLAVPANQVPVVSAGANQTIMLPVNTVALAGTVSDDGLRTGAAVTTTWSCLSGPGSVTFANATSPATTATFSTTGTYVLQLTASDTQLSNYAQVQITVAPPRVNQAPVVNAGANQTIYMPPTTQVNLAGTISDDGLPLGAVMTSTWNIISGPGSVTFGDANAPSTTATFSTLGTYVLQLSASDSALSASAAVQITVAPQPVDQAPVVSAGANQTIMLPVNTVALAGTVSDDGLPIGATVTTTWNCLSGPGSVTFANVSSLSTTATFSTSGTYILQLAASDTALTGTSNMQVTVTPPNQAPVVSAGANQAITLPVNTAPLAGTVSDDGLPIGATVTTTWSYLSGPGSVTFANAAAAATTATFSTSGTYLLRLTASDTALSNYAQCQITVNPAPINQAPTANAGPNVKVMIPNALTLAGSISDDGLPNPPGDCTATWSQVSGPGTVTFANPAAASTTATFSTAGTYVLQLLASDSVLTGTSNVTVTALAPGDFNGDGKVDGVDFLIWQAHYPGNPGIAYQCDQGDANGDGKVDGVDFLIWQANYHG